MNKWRDTLTAENIPLNVQLTFQLQNRGINAVILDGKPLNISKINKRSILELVNIYRAEVTGCKGWVFDHEETHLNIRRNESTNIIINFVDGIPTGRRAANHSKQYFERGDRASQKDSNEDCRFTIEN